MASRSTSVRLWRPDFILGSLAASEMVLGSSVQLYIIVPYGKRGDIAIN